MHICFLSYRGNMFSGGQGIYLYYLTRELANLGHKITVLVGPPYPFEMPWARVIKIPNENFYAVKRDFLPRDNPFKIFSPLNFYEFALTRFWFFPEMFAFSLRAFRTVANLVRQGERFDLIHDNQGLGYGQVLMRGLGIPVMASIHHPLVLDRSADFGQTQDLLEIARRVVFYPALMQKVSARMMELVISGSKDSALEVQRAFHIPAQKMRVVYDGVDESVFYPRASEKKIKNRLIFVGNTEDRKKGIVFLIKALARLPHSVSLMVVDGCSKWKFYLTQLIQRYQLGERVKVRSRISAEELAVEYARSEISVVPSLYEGFGLPAAEAMACGLPVVATTAGALPEVIGDDGAGILVPPKDPKAIADAVLYLIENPEAREEMGRRAVKRVESLFSWKKTAKATEEVYFELLEIHKKRKRC